MGLVPMSIAPARALEWWGVELDRHVVTLSRATLPATDGSHMRSYMWTTNSCCTLPEVNHALQVHMSTATLQGCVIHSDRTPCPAATGKRKASQSLPAALHPALPRFPQFAALPAAQAGAAAGAAAARPHAQGGAAGCEGGLGLWTAEGRPAAAGAGGTGAGQRAAGGAGTPSRLSCYKGE
jgi:hypothetical protein